jgi:two-component system response regulator AtoC
LTRERPQALGPVSALVVDDDDELRNILVRMLKNKGFEPEGAASGEQALSLLATKSFDLILLDLQLPGADGLSVLAEIRRVRPLATVVIITAHASIETAVAAMKGGAFDYVVKPIKLDAVLETTSQAIAAGILLREARYSRASVSTDDGQLVLSRDRKMLDVLGVLHRVAETPATVLIQGESGTGKELLARTIHAFSPQKKGPFVPVNCAAIPAGLEESELFGHEKGAFTGALSRRVGRFEQAHHGTLFLDEIGELSASAQAKLLRVLQERRFERVGGNQSIDVNVRVVAATHRDLDDAARAGSFRQDLYYRLAVIPIRIPALRERPADIPLLASYFVEKYNAILGRSVDPMLDVAVVQELLSRPWPGNIRELENAIQRAMTLCESGILTVADLGGAVGAASERAAPSAPVRPLIAAREEFEANYLRDLLARAQGNVSRAARWAGLSRVSLYEKMKKLNIRSSDED